MIHPAISGERLIRLAPRRTQSSGSRRRCSTFPGTPRARTYRAITFLRERRGSRDHALLTVNSAQAVIVRFRTNHGDYLATAALIQQFIEFAIGMSDLLNPANMHRQLVIIESGNLIFGHQKLLS